MENRKTLLRKQMFSSEIHGINAPTLEAVLFLPAIEDDSTNSVVSSVHEPNVKVRERL